MKKETIRFLKKIFGNNDFIRFMEWEGKLTKDALMQELAISELERELLYKTLTRIQDEVKKLNDYGYLDEMISKESEHYEQDKEYFPFIFAIAEDYKFSFLPFTPEEDKDKQGFARIIQWHGGKFADKQVWWDLETSVWVDIEKAKGKKDCKHILIPRPPCRPWGK